MNNFKLFTVGFLSTVLMLSSCGGNPSAPHVHTPGDPVKENEVAATCTEEGSYDLVTYCTSGDGYEMSREHVVVPPTHKYGSPAYEWLNNNSQCHASLTCSECDEVVEETVNSKMEIIEEATGDNPGRCQYVATFTKTEFTTQTVEATYYYHGQYPIYDYHTGYVQYGLYPQKHVNDAQLLSALNALEDDAKLSNGWYEYENNYYARAFANPWSASASKKFDDGTTFVSDVEYWFKCEPINWRIMKEYDGKLYLLSQDLIDKHTYNSNSAYYPKYQNSEIYAWLEDEFYTSAFFLDDSRIVSTRVKNDAESTGYAENEYAGSDTTRKVYLGSYQDYYSKDYGFNIYEPETTKKSRTTDYVRALGANFNSDFYGPYWTRSPHNKMIDYGYGARYFNENGYCYNIISNNTAICVRPMITIKIEEQYSSFSQSKFESAWNSKGEVSYNHLEIEIKDVDSFNKKRAYHIEENLVDDSWTVDSGKSSFEFTPTGNLFTLTEYNEAYDSWLNENGSYYKWQIDSEHIGYRVSYRVWQSDTIYVDKVFVLDADFMVLYYSYCNYKLNYANSNPLGHFNGGRAHALSWSNI